MLQGAATALITPFDNELNVDYSAWKKFLSFQIENGINALIVLGTTGEAATINEDERKKLTEIAVETADKKIPVIIGTGTNDTKKVVSLNKLAEECKADGVLIVNPYYNKGTQNSLIDHYKYIAERTPLPIILYNVPSRTAMNILPETVIKIHESSPNVIGIKEACADISQIAKLFSIKPDNFIVYSGNDDQTLPIMALGGKGLVSVLSNVYPKQTAELTQSLLQNDYEKARKINNKYLKYMNLLFVEANPIPVKYAASRLGYCRNTLRLPLAKASSTTMKLLDEEMERLND
ncbi:MAG TPA: 4-hydroxy-tetrahydrodipicolinate synthase [Ignavibacteriaceae bacterium]|nr:4-hydroxy-tetrahydrodipicolinate synthase [Ignavibacteriaceae bacterium]